MKKPKFLIFGLLAGGMLLAACTPELPQPDEPGAMSTATSTATLAEAKAKPSGQTPLAALPTASPTLEAPMATTASLTPRTELTATNLSTVSLASGQLQLLEFFAFW